MTNILQEKSDLRRLALNYRQIAARNCGSWAGEQIAKHIFEYFRTWKVSKISGYLPLGDEIEPVPALTCLGDVGWEIALPVVTGKKQKLVFRQWCPGDELEVGYLNTRHPIPSASELSPDVILAPMLAFDKEGHRLGWGGGFYDRTISALRAQNSILVLGLAFSRQEVDKVPCDRYDEPLDGVVTEKGIDVFGGEA
ncbi:MAG: 5-formyltetrahydrofolate cyclo-ligase [Magnetovibrio sp.]|nr:5-formyltetrahydrofolate cyclo-ligase [Magnetovibrio sp.]